MRPAAGRPLLALAFLCAAAAAVAAAFPRAPVAPPQSRPGTVTAKPAEAYFEPSFLRRAEDYARTKIVFALNRQAIGLAVYVTLLRTLRRSQLSDDPA